jgi:hypothetical protein
VFRVPGNKHDLKVLMLDAATGFYRMQRYRVGDFFGPVDWVFIWPSSTTP